MLKCVMALAAALLLGLATDARAQVLPQNGNGLTFVPVDTAKNSVAPVPAYGMPQVKGSYFDRFYNALASVVPFMTPRQPLVFGPGMRRPQPPLPQPQAPTTTLPGSIKLPEVPRINTGGSQ